MKRLVILCPGGEDAILFPMYTALPPDFKDRPRLERWWANVLVVFRRRPIKAVCCESFRKGKGACKGCPTVYNVQSNRWVYRTIARIGRHMTPDNHG